MRDIRQIIRKVAKAAWPWVPKAMFGGSLKICGMYICTAQHAYGAGRILSFAKSIGLKESSQDLKQYLDVEVLKYAVLSKSLVSDLVHKS